MLFFLLACAPPLTPFPEPSEQKEATSSTGNDPYDQEEDEEYSRPEDDDSGDDSSEEDGEAEDDRPEDVVEAWVGITSPMDGATVTNPVTFIARHEGVAELEILADEWALGSLMDTGTLTYTFTNVDVPRTITLEGKNEAGEVIARDTITITVTNEGEDPSSRFTTAPYYYQYDNLYEPSSTCGITSAAMMLGSRGSARTPDELYMTYGKEQGQSPEGLEQLYRWEGYSGDSGRTGSRSDLRAMLDAGDPVVVHGFWTASGHIALLVGYDSTGWLVNDPAGDWFRGYGLGGGEAAHYPFDSRWDEDLSWDGDIWWSTAR